MERVDLQQRRHAERQRWRNGDLWAPSTTCVGIGEVLDGGWYVRRYVVGAAGQDARHWTGPKAEWYARGTARRWMRSIGGTWAEV
jgi:hypothetical protein